MLKMNKTKSVKGFNLIELAIVLAVIGVIVGGIYVAASSVYENNRKQKVGQQMVQIVQAIRTAYNGMPSIPTALTTQTVKDASLAPADMIGPGTADPDILVSPYGGVVISSDDGATTFDVEFQNLSQGACADLLVKTYGSESIRNQLGTEAVAVDGTTLGGIADPTVAASNCSTTANDKTVTVTFNLRG